MKKLTALLLVALAGCASTPPAPPMPVGDFRPVNRAAVATPIADLDAPTLVNDSAK